MAVPARLEGEFTKFAGVDRNDMADPVGPELHKAAQKLLDECADRGLSAKEVYATIEKIKKCADKDLSAEVRAARMRELDLAVADDGPWREVLWKTGSTGFYCESHINKLVRVLKWKNAATLPEFSLAEISTAYSAYSNLDGAESGHLLRHMRQQSQSISVTAQEYKIGITHTPYRRWSGGHKAAGWTKMILLHAMHGRGRAEAAAYEAALIAVMATDAKCVNVNPGGEGEVPTFPTNWWFIYVVVRRKPRLVLIEELKKQVAELEAEAAPPAASDEQQDEDSESDSA